MKAWKVNSVLLVPIKEGKSCKCHENQYQVCNLIKKTSTFSHSSTYESFKIIKGPFNCNSKYVLHFIKYKVCTFK